MSDGKEAAPIRLKKPREIKKRKRRKLFGGVGPDYLQIPRHVSVDYIRRLLAHQERGGDDEVSSSEASSEISGSDLSNMSDSEASVDGSAAPSGVSAPIDNGSAAPVGSAVPGNGGVNPIDQAFNYVNSLTSTLASNQNLNVPEINNSVGDALDYAASLASTLAKSVDNETPEIVNPVGDALDYAASLASTLAKSVNNETPETINPVGDALDYAASLASTLAKSVESETPDSNPAGEAIDYAASLASMLVKPLSLSPGPGPGPGTVPRTLFDLSPPPPPSEYPTFPKLQFNPSDKIKQFLDSWWSDEDETKYEVGEYATALGSDTKQNLRSTMYDKNGTVQQPNAASYQHQWKEPQTSPVVAL
jgi:hypothetical protein